MAAWYQAIWHKIGAARRLQGLLDGNPRILWPGVIERVTFERRQTTVSNKQDTPGSMARALQSNRRIATGKI